MKINKIITLSFSLCLSLLVAAMQQVDPRNIEQFFAAVKNNDFEQVKAFIDAGIDVNAVNDKNQTPLIFSHSLEMAELLVNHGAYVNVYNPASIDLLEYIMVEFQDPSLAEFLIENTPDQYIDVNSSLLPLAIEVPYMISIAELLLDKGVNSNAKDEAENTGLHWASNSYDGDSIAKAELLLEHNANINATNNDGDTPLHTSIFNDYCYNAVALFLIDHGALINAKNNDGTTPLHMAMAPEEELDTVWNLENTDIIKALIEHGADINAQNDEGDTPLHEGIENLDENNEEEKIQRIKILLDNGADINIKNNEDKTPYQLAEESGNPELLALFDQQFRKNLLQNLMFDEGPIIGHKHPRDNENDEEE